MKNQIQTQYFLGKPIRFILDEKNNPLFVANDACEILGYTNPNKAIKDHCKTKGVTNRYPLSNKIGGAQYPNLITEGNLYRLIIKSEKPEAEPFESWVTDEVLPTIRKNGGYSSIDIDSIAAEFRMLYERHDKIKAQIKDLEAEKKDLEKTIRYKTTNINDIKTAIPYPGNKVDYIIEKTENF